MSGVLTIAHVSLISGSSGIVRLYEVYRRLLSGYPLAVYPPETVLEQEPGFKGRDRLPNQKPQ